MPTIINIIPWIILLSLPNDEAQQQAPPPPHETVVVTATGIRETIADSVSLVTALGREELQHSPALTLDDRLRRVPGFSLFRRSSSLAAHPTTQGVSLRGIGPSGASRSLVLFDGIPLNDPLGGWVYWNRIPILALDSVEIARGAGSQLYGSSALGGTLQLIPSVPQGGDLQLRGQLGNHETYDLEALASSRHGNWAYLASGRAFDNDGFFIVDEDQRGAVDRPADLQFQSFLGRVWYKDLHATVNLYRERRGNGTQLQRNNSHFELFEVGMNRPGWRWSFHAQNGLFASRFSRILPDRSAEFLTANQLFETHSLGASFLRRLGGRLQIGGDWRLAGWDDQRQNLAGLFIQDLVKLHARLDLLMGLRLDVWENRDTQSELNPRLGLAWRPASPVTLRASGYRGFRAPTLNELFRPFRVGNVVTDANDQLGSESLWGGEAGLDFHPGANSLFRLNGFYSALQDPVGNVTVGQTPSLILRQRQNLGRVTIRGIEAEAISRRGSWTLQAAYIYSHSQVRETGLRLPQAPLHQASAGVTWTGPIRVSADGRFISSQFDDDLNQRRLGGFALFDLSVSKAVSERWELFAALQNLFDRDYAVAQTPVEQQGPPRLVHGGLRFRLKK